MSKPVLRLSTVHSSPAQPPDVATERRWVHGAVTGDESAFEAIFLAYNRELCRFARYLLGNQDDAEDVVQGVFVAIWKNRADWSVREPLRVYLYSAVRNRAAQHLRNVRRRQAHTAEVLHFSTRSPSEAFASPDVHAHHREFDAALAAAVEALPPRCREVFLLTRHHGMTYQEAAATMGISPRTVMVQMGRALAALRKRLAPFLIAILTLV